MSPPQSDYDIYRIALLARIAKGFLESEDGRVTITPDNKYFDAAVRELMQGDNFNVIGGMASANAGEPIILTATARMWKFANTFMDMK
jgi:hypothetical protein